jgi:hypothetical protein
MVKKAQHAEVYVHSPLFISLLQVDRIGVKIASSHLHSYSPSYPQAKDKGYSFPFIGAGCCGKDRVERVSCLNLNFFPLIPHFPFAYSFLSYMPSYMEEESLIV